MCIRDRGGSGPTADKRLAHITLRQNAAEDRAYIESCFGRSLYPPERPRKAEQALCTGAHLGCRLWFASGVPSPEQAPTCLLYTSRKCGDAFLFRGMGYRTFQSGWSRSG